MNLRQAAQQALEALEKVKTDADKQPPVYPWDIWRMWVDRAITNLRAALAEPEQPVAWSTPERFYEQVNRAVEDMRQRMLIKTVTMRCKDFDLALQVLDAREGHVLVAGTAPTPQPEREPVAWRLYKDGQLYSIKFEKEDRGPSYTWEPLYTAPTPQREHSTDGSPCWCNPDVIEEDGGNVIVHNYDDNWQQYAKPGETAQQCIERHRAEQDALMKLYATPRRPLTNEEISAILDDTLEGGSFFDVALAVARAIERAHGITGEAK